MATAGHKGRLPAEREDHYMRLPGAETVSTRILLAVQENIRAAIEKICALSGRLLAREGQGWRFPI